MEKICITVTMEQEEERVDKVITEEVAALSRSFVQKLIKENQLFVNEVPVKASYRVKEGDRIVFSIPKAVEPDIEPENIKLDILYEDEDLLVINKPKDMVVHPAPGHYSGTLVNAVLWHCKGNLSGINGILRPGIVHRIDKDTTGALIVCKNDVAHNHIAAQLKDHSIQRKYYAIVHGVIKEEAGTVEGAIGRDPFDRKKMCINEKNGKSAITHYKVLKRFAEYTYISCQLETGRTHQIRVHMTSIGHPLLGDEVYGKRASKFRLQGQTLHAGSIGFIHPATETYMEFQAPLPEYFSHLLQVLKSD
ncbi:MAG: RluA family pseudouridine synthase [Roseburia sp.]|nr:RluA family pseudouridine synthase [Roseburia sp.]MCM1279250.1 RluA family pseudouridine synthase [Robinsoniella sp.]